MVGARSHGRFALAVLSMIVLVGCASPPPATHSARPSTMADSARPGPAPAPAQPSSAGDPTRPPSPPKDVTYSTDRHYYSSPWYDGPWQEMNPFGCTNAPYYARDRTCPRSKPGKHHGIDMFMLCGTKVRSAVNGFVVRSPDLGAAYGRLALKIRSGRFDYVLGHVRRVYVQPGQRVRPGQLIARSGKLGAPDGCHLHFEKRPAGRGFTDAVNPLKSLRRTVVRFSHG